MPLTSGLQKLPSQPAGRLGELAHHAQRTRND